MLKSPLKSLALVLCLFFSPWAFGSFFDGFLDFDPKNILVEDPHTLLLAELPRGDINLKEFRATSKDFELYSKYYSVEQPDKKDHPNVPLCTRAEVDAVKRWQGNDHYQTINQILRAAQKGKLNGAPISEKNEVLILMIASATHCGPQYDGPVIRGEKIPPDFIFVQYQEGNLLGLRGFTSTTKGTKLTQYFEEQSRIRIYIEKAAGADFDAFGVSPWPMEKEVLIRPGTVFQVRTKTKALAPPWMEWDFSFEQY